MNAKEVDRWYVVREVMEGKMKQREAGRVLGKSTRHIRRLVARVRREGRRGVVHGLKGRASARRTAAATAWAVEKAIAEQYADFGPALVQEMLAEREGIRLSVSTVRRLMIRAQQWKAKRGKGRHRAWRERRHCVGMMVQVDGSEHAWFEERGTRCTLIVFVDDATGRIMEGSFEESEDTLTLMRLTRRYVERHGRPVELYVDRDSIYRVNRAATIEEELQDEQAETQYVRAARALGIVVRCATSPHANGRVERACETLQDRLVKELRLAGVSTREQGNAFLPGFLARYNQRCGVAPVDEADVHRPLLKEHRLDEIVTIRTPRVVANDYTVRCRKRVFQLLKRQPVRVYPRLRIEVEIRLDGSMHLRHRGNYLNVKDITAAVRATRDVSSDSTPSDVLDDTGT